MEPARNASHRHDAPASGQAVTQAPTPPTTPQQTPPLATATPGHAPGDAIAHQMCEAMQALPFTHLYAFARTLARDLGHGDDRDSVVRVAEALVATAAVWRIAAQ